MMNTKLTGKGRIFAYFLFNLITNGIYWGQAGKMYSAYL